MQIHGEYFLLRSDIAGKRKLQRSVPPSIVRAAEDQLRHGATSVKVEVFSTVPNPLSFGYRITGN